MSSFLLRSLGLVLAAALVMPAAQAAMSIDNAIIAFKPGDPSRKDVTVFNPDKEPLYVKVEILEVRNPGTSEEKRELVKDPEKISLLATPSKLMIEPGGRRVVRIVNLAPNPATERVYRVNLLPVVGKLQVSNNESDESAMALKIVIGYQLLVLVAPAGAKEGLDVQRNGNVATLRNTGSTNIQLFSGTQCPSADAPETACKQLPDRRLYPGNEWVLELPFDQPFDYQMTVLEKHQKRSFE